MKLPSVCPQRHAWLRFRRDRLSQEALLLAENHRLAHWIKFADGMSVRLSCDREAVGAWWSKISARYPRPISVPHQTACEVLK